MNFQWCIIINIWFKIFDLDFLGINIFGLFKDLEQDMVDFVWMWDGLYFVSEWNINGYWEVFMIVWGVFIEDVGWKKGEELVECFYQEMFYYDFCFLGSCLFYWGYKQEWMEIWFNIFIYDGIFIVFYEVYEQLNDCFFFYFIVFELKYMFLDSVGSFDYIMFYLGQFYMVYLVFDYLFDFIL